MRIPTLSLSLFMLAMIVAVMTVMLGMSTPHKDAAASWMESHTALATIQPDNVNRFDWTKNINQMDISTTVDADVLASSLSLHDELIEEAIMEVEYAMSCHNTADHDPARDTDLFNNVKVDEFNELAFQLQYLPFKYTLHHVNMALMEIELNNLLGSNYILKLDTDILRFNDDRRIVRRYVPFTGEFY